MRVLGDIQRLIVLPLVSGGGGGVVAVVSRCLLCGGRLLGRRRLMMLVLVQVVGRVRLLELLLDIVRVV